MRPTLSRRALALAALLGATAGACQRNLSGDDDPPRSNPAPAPAPSAAQGAAQIQGYTPPTAGEPLEQRVAALERSTAALSQSNEQLRQQLAQTQAELRATQEQVRVMQSEARTARRVVRGYQQQQQPAR